MQFRHRTAILQLILLVSWAVLGISGIDVLDQRVGVPKPDGSGVVVILLQADPADPDVGDVTGFTITGLDFIAEGTQQLRLWNAAGQNCDGDVLTDQPGSNAVPLNGLVCFSSDTSVSAEFQNSFTFEALPTATNEGTVTLLNYDRQLCPGIPDLGGSGSFKVPPAPAVDITLAGLQIKFSVDATYVRNETSWYLDFFSFDSSPGGDSADGTGRTCANHLPANYPASFHDWWFSAPRATYDSSVHATIDDALNDAVYPNYRTSGTPWTITASDCSTVNFEATIPVSQLVRNLPTDCQRTGDTSPAATTGGDLQYAGTLYAYALRPNDRTDAAQGYFKSTFQFPFAFSLQTTISDLSSTSSEWSLVVNVLNSVVTYTGGAPSYTLDIQTVISKSGVNSPNVLQSGFSLSSYPHDTLRTSIGAAAQPTLTRESANANCGTGTNDPCIINWRMVMPQLSLADLSDSQPDFDTQYVGGYSFHWTTTDNDVLSADLYADVSAANPATNLSQIPVTSELGFYSTLLELQDTTAVPMATPQYSSGERIFVRHSFLVDEEDIQAFVFSLKQAWVCFSRVPGFAPSISGAFTGCSVDIPGVMEAANGERFQLYDRDTLAGGIADFEPSNAGEQAYIWDWDLVEPTDESWTDDATVHNGFAINAQPLAVDGDVHTYYFHLVSTVAQAALDRRGAPGEQEVHHIVRMNQRATVVPPSSGVLQSVVIGGPDDNGSSSSSGAPVLTPAVAALIAAAKELL